MTPYRGVIIEGVSGSGKSSLIASLRSILLDAETGEVTVHDEEETFGDFVAQAESVQGRWADGRLTAVMGLLRHPVPSTVHVVERFHLSFQAVRPRWSAYAAVDAELAALNFAQVLLTLPEQEVLGRCLQRPDRAETTWYDDMARHFGSVDAAASALVVSQRRRLECLSLTAIPTLVLNTHSRDWQQCAGRVAEFCGFARSFRT